VLGVPRADYDDPPSELLRLGLAVRALRQRKGLKQIELATAAGISESQVSDIERGKNNPGWRLIVRIVNDGLGLTISDLADAYARADDGDNG
jgi:transcriptional regulator with XRE-family HTH domain